MADCMNCCALQDLLNKKYTPALHKYRRVLFRSDRLSLLRVEELCVEGLYRSLVIVPVLRVIIVFFTYIEY